MRRREFITLVGGAAAVWPFTGFAQTKKRPLVGWLWYSEADIIVGYLQQLLKGMRELGLIEGRDFDMVYRSAEFHLERLARAAEELVQRQNQRSQQTRAFRTARTQSGQVPFRIFGAHGAQRSIQRVSIRYFFSVKWVRTSGRLVQRWRRIIGVLS
jgi:hypothetical protein